MEFTCESPEANLEWDDALLERQQEAIRLWESPVPFVVLGRSCEAAHEVRSGVDIPVLRRSTGGGTVLQGPGCLNYTLILSMENRHELRAVDRSYEVVLAWVVRTLALPGLGVRESDIVLGERKVSGNAQRRSHAWLLHHGTLLYEAFDLAQVERVQTEPVRRPAYREDRTHKEFLTKMPLTRQQIVDRLSDEAFESLRQQRYVPA